MQNYIPIVQRLMAVLALLAVSVHSLIPVGYMPDFSGKGMLVVCDGVHHHMPSGSGDSQKNTSHDSVCPFSVGAVYGFEGITTPVIIAPVYGDAPSASLKEEFFRESFISGGASPRAPPFFS